MRKFMFILLVLCLTAVPCFAEDSAHDFGHFTIHFPEDMTTDIAEEITEDVPFFTLSLNDHPISILNGTWLSACEDLTQVDPDVRAQERLDGVVAAYKQAGVAVDNPKIIGAALGEQDGKPALMLIVSVDLTFPDAEVQMTQYVIQGIVSDEAFGTYLFTINTDDLEAAQPLMEVMDTIDWKD